MSDHPFDECAAAALDLVEHGVTIFQKFTCDKCGSRQGIEDPNVFYTTGKCEECGHITDIRARGCNYLAMANDAESAAYLIKKGFA
jgi:hypothetical protein